MVTHSDLHTESQTLNLFFDKVKTIGFMARIFNWKPFRTLSFEAYDQYQRLMHDKQHYDNIPVGALLMTLDQIPVENDEERMNA